MDVAGLFERHGDELFRYLFRQCGDRELARDAVQETFLRLQSRPPDGDRGLRPWLFRTGLNVIRDHRRVEANRERLLEWNSDSVPGPSSPRTPEAGAELEDSLARLRTALDGLRQKERTALLMREEGFTHREIAEELGTTTGTVGTLIARSLAKLEAAYRKLGEST
jgi:RNA polymerase sigma factor (sigma-70 family)